MAKDVTLPSIRDLLLPVLKATRDLGGSASRSELVEHVRDLIGLTDEQLAVVYSGPSGKPKALHRVQWAIYWLKRIGALQNSKWAVWALTPEGNRYLEMDEVAAIEELSAAYEDSRKQLAAEKAAKKAKAKKDGQDDAETGAVPGDDWKAELLATLKQMDPSAFERLAKRILREAGFQKVEVVGSSGDSGLDGVGLYRMSLVSFPIYFQCKRYAGSVGAGPVRDFRGAMAGRGEKGLLITTGTFTPAARREATRDGAPPVDLIDSDELCELILKYRVGVKVTHRTVEDIKIDGGFFANV